MLYAESSSVAAANVVNRTKKEATRARRMRQFNKRHAKDLLQPGLTKSSVDEIPPQLLLSAQEPPYVPIAALQNRKRVKAVADWAVKAGASIREVDDQRTVTYSLRRRIKRHKTRLVAIIESTVRTASKIRLLASRFATAFCLFELNQRNDVSTPYGQGVICEKRMDGMVVVQLPFGLAYLRASDVTVVDSGISPHVGTQQFWRACMYLNSSIGDHLSPQLLPKRSGPDKTSYPQPTALYQKMDEFASKHWWPSLPATFSWPSRRSIFDVCDYHAKAMAVELKMLYERETFTRIKCMVSVQLKYVVKTSDIKINSKQFHSIRTSIIDAICENDPNKLINIRADIQYSSLIIMKRHRAVLPENFILDCDSVSSSDNLGILMKYWHRMSQWKEDIYDSCEDISIKQQIKQFVLLPHAKARACFITINKKIWGQLLRLHGAQGLFNSDFLSLFAWPREKKWHLLASIQTDGVQIKFSRIVARFVQRTDLKGHVQSCSINPVFPLHSLSLLDYIYIYYEHHYSSLPFCIHLSISL